MSSKVPPDAERDDLDPDAPPTEAELAAAARLSRVLESGSPEAVPDPEWELVEAIRASSSPTPLAAERQRKILAAAMSKTPRGKVIYLAFGGVASLAAMAAALALVVRGESPPASVASFEPVPPMAVSRSAEALFPDGIPVRGGTSDRIDRIAYARARDLRENRFAGWGVR
jgi:hypothetical protein